MDYTSDNEDLLHGHRGEEHFDADEEVLVAGGDGALLSPRLTVIAGGR